MSAIDQIEVHYYFSSEESSDWQASVDSFVQHAPDIDLSDTSEVSIAELVPHLGSSSAGCQTHFIRVRNSNQAELPPANADGDPYLEFQVTLTPTDGTPANQSHADDYSHNASATTFESNLSSVGPKDGKSSCCNT